MSLFQESGGTPADRSEEARKILFDMGLETMTGAMTPKEAKFVSDMAQRFQDFGPLAFVSPKQVFWLRDLAEKFLH